MAGQLGRDEHLNAVEDKEAQFAQAFKNVEKILSAAGATFDDVVDMVTYHTDARGLRLFMEEVSDRFFTNLERLPTLSARDLPLRLAVRPSNLSYDALTNRRGLDRYAVPAGLSPRCAGSG